MLLQCYMQNTATSRVVENEMQVKNFLRPRPARSINPMMIYHEAQDWAKLFRTRASALSANLLIFGGNFADEKHRFSSYAKRTIKTNTKASATQPPLLVAMMYCLRRFVNPSLPPSPLSSANYVQLHPTPTPPSSALSFTNPSYHLPPSDLLP
jgi:hypothetical protein